MNYGDKLGRRVKGKKNSLYKYEINLKMWCSLMWCVGQCWEKCHIYKKDIWMSL